MLRQLGNLIKRFTASSDTQEGKMHTVDIDVSSTDRSEAVERWQSYGLSARPAKGAAGIVVTVGGHRFALALDHLDGKPSLDVGEVALWHKAGHWIKLGNDGKVHIPCDLVVGGAITSGSTITSAGAITGAGVNFNTHHHREHDGPNTGGPL